MKPPCAATQAQNIRKVVGKKLKELSVFERIRKLQASLQAMGLQQKQDDGEYIRRIVGAASKK